MAYKISDDCIACGACADECPVSCIKEGDGKYHYVFSDGSSEDHDRRRD